MIQSLLMFYCVFAEYNHCLMRNYSRQPTKTYYKAQSPARALSLPKPAPQKPQVKANEVQVGIYKYNPEDVLGKGYSSKVYKGVQIGNVYKRFAIKVIELKKFRGSSLEMLEAEIQIHRNLVHDNILRLYEIIKTPYFYYLILEYCPHGNLHEYIKQKKQLTQSNATEIIIQVLEGYNYLSGQNIMHRDLKPANILRIGNKWKISDFGFAVKSKYGFKDRINVGTPLYMPPQTILKTYYSNKTDIFALGVILYEMIEGKTPWESSNEKELIEKLKKELVLPESIRHPKIREFVSKCCQLNEAKRMSKEELLTFSFKTSEDQLNNFKTSSRSSSHSKIYSPKKSSIVYETVPPVNPQQQTFRHNQQKLHLQFQFARHLFTCIKNKSSFLFQGETSEIFILTIFKFSLKLLRSLCDRKTNNFHLKMWQQFSSSPIFQALLTQFNIQLQREEKQYLEYIKHYDIKIIRSVNRRFPDLCNTTPVGQRFYETLKHFITPIIRQHNHELMLVHNKNENQRKNIVVLPDSLIKINDKVQAIDALYTIYTVADIRTHASSKELSLSSFKVVEDYKASQLNQEDYIDMRRLIRNV